MRGASTCVRLLFLALSSLALTLFSTGHHAGSITTPTGLAPGNTFRIVFVTDGTTSTPSTNISTYNNFVAAQANNETYERLDNNVECHREHVHSGAAINNIGTYNVPVYLANGTLVSRSDGYGNGGLFTGKSESTINTDLAGGALVGLVWTGSNSAGNITTGFALGDPDTTVGMTESFKGAAATPTGISCCHLQVYWLIRQDLAAFPLFQALAGLPLKPIGKLLPIAVQFDAAQV